MFAHVPLLFTTTLLSLFAVSSGAPQLGGLLGGIVTPIVDAIPGAAAPPLAGLMTTDPSPQCANVNQGTLLCCADTLNGDTPQVVLLAQLTGYPLDPNSINGFFCTKKNSQTCNPGTKLCCQVDKLMDLLNVGLYCANAP